MTGLHTLESASWGHLEGFFNNLEEFQEVLSTWLLLLYCLLLWLMDLSCLFTVSCHNMGLYSTVVRFKIQRTLLGKLNVDTF